MFIIISIIIIALISVGLAFLSFRNIQKGLGKKETEATQEQLKQERVIFHSSDVSSSDSSM